MEPYIINQTGDQLQSILNKAIIKAELQTTEDGNQAIRFTASDGTSISVTLPEWSKRIEYLLQNTYYLQEGIGCATFDYTMPLGDVPIQSEEVTRQDSDSIILDTSANRFVLERGGKFYTKFLSNGGNLQGSDVYASSRHTFLNRQDTSYWYRKEDGTLAQGSSTFVIGNWLKTLQSECDSTQETAETARTVAQGANTTATEAKEAAAAAQTKNADQDTRIAALLQYIPWEGYHMNAFTDTGEYHIHGESTDANDGMPILNSGTIDARLTVLDSSLTNGTGEKTDIVVTQILRLSNRMGGDGHVYVRTAQAATKSQLATPSSTAWSTWEKLMGMFEKNAVTNIADLNTYTTNGMYSGLFADTTLQTLGGLQFTPGDTFLLITVNGYAASAFGTPQITQMLYRLPSKKGSGNSSARMYMRTAYWNASADPKKWEFANWDRLAMASEISGGGGGSIEEYNRLIELIAANTEKISSVESTANSAKSAAETAQTAATTAQETANSASEKATAASTDAQEAKTAAENEATARAEADTELQSQINGKQDNIGSFSADEKAAFLVSLGLGKIGIVSQKQTWNGVGVEPAYVMSEKVEGFISKDNIDSLISYGFAFNEGTGYFELNGLTDISLQEALNIVAAGKPNFSLCDLHYANKNIRTNLPILDNVDYNVYFLNGVSNPIRISYMASYSNIEVFAYYPYKIKNNYATTGLKRSSISKGSLAFFSCNKLEKIDVIPGTATDFFQSFEGCLRLKELELVYLRCDVNLSSSAYLSAKSTHIMIANADNSNAITITLHSDAKARWEASEYYEEDSQTIISKNITIA